MGGLGGQAGYFNRMRSGMITGKVKMNSAFMDGKLMDHNEDDDEQKLQD